MPSADQVPVKTSHSRMQWHEWVVLIAGSTGSALRAVRPPNLHIAPGYSAQGTRRDLVRPSARPGSCDTYRGPPADHCPIHYQPPPNEDLQLEINPAAGASPLRLGTRDLNSFFAGGLSRVRIWNRVLKADEVSALYFSDAVPSDGLVAEFLLNADTGTSAADSARGNDGTIFGAVWDIQQ
jgi:hypothetical protein